MATRLIQSVGVLQTFACLDVAFLLITVVTGPKYRFNNDRRRNIRIRQPRRGAML